MRQGGAEAAGRVQLRSMVLLQQASGQALRLRPVGFAQDKLLHPPLLEGTLTLTSRTKCGTSSAIIVRDRPRK